MPGKFTVTDSLAAGGARVPVFTNEFWTARQRQAASIHEISYRACFKPQLPRFFIRLLTAAGDPVYDPFSGRGTTAIEAALLGRKVIANDVNPLSKIICQPRLAAPASGALSERLAAIPRQDGLEAETDLSMFFHPETLAEILSLRRYLQERRERGLEDETDRWIRMVATNRLTGHSSGFFSVYTLPPNQAASPENQVKINRKRHQQPDYRETKSIILKKTHSLLKGLGREDYDNLRRAGTTALFLEADARYTADIAGGSVQLTVTSPPFLDVVQYTQDNWLRCWFNQIDSEKIEKQITMSKTLEDWCAVMGAVFKELYRVTMREGWVAFEVGEVRRGRIRLEEAVIPLGLEAGFKCIAVLINRQEFTKTANIWGIKNNTAGTNSNRIVLFFKG
ncbi:MAG: DNA methyltransferase [Bacillota bacterium]